MNYKNEVMNDIKRMSFGIEINKCQIMTMFNLCSLDIRMEILNESFKYSLDFVHSVLLTYENRPNELNYFLENNKMLKIHHEMLNERQTDIRKNLAWNQPISQQK
jgi:hypothetical protein